MVALEKKVLEKVLMQELFESILEEMQTDPWRAYFQRKKLINLINKNWHEKTANSVQQTKTKMENKLTKKKKKWLWRGGKNESRLVQNNKPSSKWHQ